MINAPALFVLAAAVFAALAVTAQAWVFEGFKYTTAEGLVGLLLPVGFGCFLGRLVPDRYWGAYFSLALLAFFGAAVLLRVGLRDWFSVFSGWEVLFAVLFASGCMFAAQSLIMGIRFERRRRVESRGGAA